MKHIIPLVIPILGLLAIGCSNDDIVLDAVSESVGFTPVGNPVQVSFNISAQPFEEDATTRAEETVKDTFTGANESVALEREKYLYSFWIFEFDAETDSLICDPVYCDEETATGTSSTEGTSKLNITLRDNNGEPVIIYVIANADMGNDASDWVTLDYTTGEYEGFMTIEELLKQELPTKYTSYIETDGYSELSYSSGTTASKSKWPMFYADGYYSAGSSSKVVTYYNDYIPKSGCIGEGEDDKVYVTEGETITVPVSNMYARLLINANVDGYEEGSTSFNRNIVIENVPCYCTVGPLADKDTTNPYKYPGDVHWAYVALCTVTSTLKGTYPEDDDATLVVYVPENIQGENGTSETTRADNVPTTQYTTTIKDVVVPSGNKSASRITAVSEETDAMAVHFHVGEMGGETVRAFMGPIYPGGNNTTNFNVRRNCSYRVVFNVVEAEPDNTTDVYIDITNGDTEGYFNNWDTFTPNKK